MVYTGKNAPLNCPNLKKNDIRILPTRQYLPQEKTLNFIHKYFVESYKIIALNDTILVLENARLLGYTSKEPPVYREGCIKFKRSSEDKRLNMRQLLEAEGLAPYLTIAGMVQSVKQIKEGHIVTVKTDENVIYQATIIKDILIPKSRYQTFEVGDKAILNGDVLEGNTGNQMIVKRILLL